LLVGTWKVRFLVVQWVHAAANGPFYHLHLSCFNRHGPALDIRLVPCLIKFFH
jgi:hypothetical protein